MPEIDHRPANGGGSCPTCGDSLNLASIKRGDTWYCSAACADGRTSAAPRAESVPEPWLYARPRRFFKRRKPKELNAR